MKLHYSKSDLRKFQIGRYVEIMTLPDQEGNREVAGLGTIVGIDTDCFDELVFRVDGIDGVAGVQYHPSNLQLID
jgi:hypothetical protein